MSEIVLPKLTDATLELHGRVAVLTLDRDDVRNALTGTALVDDLLQTLAWAEAAPEVAVLVVTGAGAAFCAGGNVKEMAERKGIFAGSALDVQEQYRQGIQRLPRAMHRSDLVLVAAVNGPAVGAGFDLANMCDLRLAAEGARFGETFVNLGIIPGDGGAWFLQRLVGFQRAAELTLTGRLIDAQEALRLGLLLEVTTADRLLPRTLELASQIAAKPPQALRLAKRLLRMARRQDLDDFLEQCAAFQGMAHQTAEHQAALQAFLAKGKPAG